jgi:hypothetical protein
MFSPVEYASAWDYGEHSWLEPLDNAHADTATRHVLQLLQELYHYGEPVNNNRVTTPRCNFVLQSLLPLKIQGRAARGDAILQRMELFDNVQLSPPSASGRWPMEVPKPSRETYNAVLQLLSRTSGTRNIPDRAQALVEKMEWRYTTLGELEMKPFAFHWNCVLLAWKECEDWDKAVHATSLVLRLRKEDPGLLDASSYVNLLRTCAHRHTSEKQALLGANIAIKIWQELFEADEIIEVPNLPSHFYAHVLQAIRHLPSEEPMRSRYYDLCFAKACAMGKVNAVLLNEFLAHVGNRSISDKHLGVFKTKTLGMPKAQAVEVMMALMPDAWRVHADLAPSRDDGHAQ